MTNRRPTLMLSKAEVKRLRALSAKKGRSVTDSFLVEGWKTVHEALQSAWTVHRVVVDPERITTENEKVLEAAALQKVDVISARKKDIDALASSVHAQGILAVVEQPSASMQNVLARPGHILALDGIADPGNLGSLIRSADWFGFTGVILGEGCASPFNEKSVRSTAGSLFHIPVVAVKSLIESLSSLKRSGRRCIAADVRGGTIVSVLPKQPMVLILGNEAHGLSKGVFDAVDVRVSIPSYGNAESLNVAAAGSVLMSQFAELTHPR